MGRNTIIMIGLTGFLLLFMLSLQFGGEKIEQDLTNRAAALLEKNNLGWVELTADGREILLTGVAPDQSTGQRAVSLIRTLEGVGGVKKKFSYNSAVGVSNIKPLSTQTDSSNN